MSYSDTANTDAPNVTSPVLFLDIDGVLVTLDSCRPKGAVTSIVESLQAQLNTDVIAALHNVLMAANAKVVMSSTWRKFDDHMEALKMAWPDIPLHEDWRTIEIIGDEKNGIVSAEGRGAEIKEWLLRHPEVVHYAVVDDEISTIHDRIDPKKIVHTTWEYGLEEEHLNAIIGLLAPVKPIDVIELVVDHMTNKIVAAVQEDLPMKIFVDGVKDLLRSHFAAHKAGIFNRHKGVVETAFATGVISGEAMTALLEMMGSHDVQ